MDPKPTAPALPSRLRSIDLLRGVAALGVLCFHSLPPVGAAGPGALFYLPWLVINHGFLGVPLFFVISGFCIHLRWAKSYAQTKNENVDFLEFWKRRLHRLYPPYFVMVCISMAFMLLAYHQGRADIYPNPKLRWIGLDFLAHITMLHGFSPLFDQAGGNPPMWTLAREEYFYILYFALLAWRRTRHLAATVGAVLLIGWGFALAAHLLVPADSPWWKVINNSALVLWIQWVLGMVAVEAYYGLVKLPRWCSSPWLVPVWLVLGEASLNFCPQLSNLLRGMTFFTLVNYCVDLEKAGRWPEHRVLNWLSGVGIFSYSIYLVHNPVINILGHLLDPHLNPLHRGPALLGMAIKILVGFNVARLFYWLVERHFLNTKPKPASVPLVPELSASST